MSHAASNKKRYSGPKMVSLFHPVSEYSYDEYLPHMSWSKHAARFPHAVSMYEGKIIS